ncbi:MAG: phosphatidylserine decarboxylase [Roseburia sp.]|nr:phosphatidylserine decarboxylase [Roseburia sp.]
MKDTLILRFLYRTVPGRMTLKILVHPWVSKAAGCFLSSKASRFLVPYYVKKNHISLENIAVPVGGFSSFNEFFTRKSNTEGEFITRQGCVISPCDGFLTPVEIKNGRVFDIKNAEYSLEDLLKSHSLGEKFKDGMAFVFRLTPANYHRYCYAVSGKISASRRIEGVLHCVRPVALRTFPVFVQNSREYQVIRSENSGIMVQMEIGALLVGKIKNHRFSSKTKKVYAGEEKGYFEFGGSTIVLLFQKDTVFVKEELYQRLDDNGEIPVRTGENVAHFS